MFQFKLETYMKVQMLIAVCLNLGELINGYGVAWSAPMLPKLQDPEQTPFSVPHSLSSSEQSWVASAIYFGAPGAFFGGYLANTLGRRKTLIIGGTLNLLVNILIASARNLLMLYIGRALLGLSMSLIAVTGLIYIGEIASPNIRGIMLTSTGVFHALGGLLVYSVGPFVSYAGVGYVVIAINVVYAVACWFLPESPMFYIIKDNEEAARLTLQYLGRDVDVSSELKTMMEKVRAQQQKKQAWRDLFTVKFNRFSLFITVCLTFFREVILGVYFYLKIIEHPNIESLGLMPLISMVAAIFMYSVGLTVIPNTLAGELFTYKVRGLGTSCALIGGWISGLISTTVFGYVISLLGGHVAFWIFAAIDATAFVFVIAFVPETKGKSLMEIQLMFEGRRKV